MNAAPHVIPAKAGIHDFSLSQPCKPWIPAVAGMTRAHRRRADQLDTRYYGVQAPWRFAVIAISR
jgi:hypothetical protein